MAFDVERSISGLTARLRAIMRMFDRLTYDRDGFAYVWGDTKIFTGCRAVDDAQSAEAND